MKSSSVSCVSITVAFSPSLALLWTISTEFFFFVDKHWVSVLLCHNSIIFRPSAPHRALENVVVQIPQRITAFISTAGGAIFVLVFCCCFICFFFSLSFAFSERQPRVLWPALSWPSGGLHFVVIFIEHATILHHSSTRWQHCLVLSWLQQHEHFNVRIPYGINIINNFGLFWVYWDHLDGIIKIIIKSQMSLQAAMALVQTLTLKEKFS